MSPETARGARPHVRPSAFRTAISRRKDRSSRAPRSIRPCVGRDGVYRLNGPGEGVSHRAGGDRRDQGEPHQGRRCARADLPRPDGRRHGGNLPAHRRAPLSAVRQACRGRHRRALQRRLDRRVYRSCVARSARRRTDWPAAGRRPDRDRHRPRTLEGIAQLRRRVRRGGRSEAGRASSSVGACARSRADPALPDDTRIWAALQDVSGGAWGGSVYDTEAESCA